MNKPKPETMNPSALSEKSERTVTIIERHGWIRRIVRVTVPWTCLECGEPRGEPYNLNMAEDGDYFSVDVWDNPCGHIDKYNDVLAELRKSTAA